MSNILSKIQDKESEIEGLIDEYLMNNGWRRTCRNPLFLVLWEKEINGKLVMVSKDIAFPMQIEM